MACNPSILLKPQALDDALIGLIAQAYWDALATVAVLQSATEPADLEVTGC
jgi:hypothetical protein